MGKVKYDLNLGETLDNQYLEDGERLRITFPDDAIEVHRIKYRVVSVREFGGSKVRESWIDARVHLVSVRVFLRGLEAERVAG